MELQELVETFADQPIVESASIVTLTADSASARVQISRWVASGHLVQLRRGYYLLAPRYRRREPDLHYIANILHAPSYISLTYALNYYGMIPEAVVAITSVTTQRPMTITTPVGRFSYRHLAPKLFWGYETQERNKMTPVQLALPEKALLDLIYLTPGESCGKFLESLRLQNLDILDLRRLADFAERFGGRKMPRAGKAIERYIREAEGEGK